MNERLMLGLFALSAVLGGCTDLDSIDAGVCGNGVLEGSEDCDQTGGQCIPPGQPFECRFTCESDDECTPGWRCGADAICREPTGTFRVGESFPADGQFELAVGELDGKKPADLLTATFSGELMVRYGGSGLEETSRFQSRPFRPAVGNLTEGDSVDDVAHVTDFAVGVLLGSEEKSLSPVAYAPLPVKEASSRFAIFDAKWPAVVGEPKTPAEIREVRYYTFDDILEFRGNKIIDAFSEKPDEAIATMPFDVSTLLPASMTAQIPVGQIDERPASPCKEVVLMSAGAGGVVIYSPCKLGGKAWNADVAALPTVTLQFGAKLGPGGTLADVDGDGHLDLLLLSDETFEENKELKYRTYVAFGAGDGTFNSTSPAVVGATDNQAALTGLGVPELPLAAGDLNGDGKADFVFPSAFVFSRPGCAQIDKLCYDGMQVTFGGFSQALIGDFNANGLNDIVAISPVVRGVFFFNGTGSNVTNMFQIATEDYPWSLSMGDFDGDLVKDVAISEIPGGLIGVSSGTKGGDATGSPSANGLSVLFGKAQGAPEPPVRMGELAFIEGTATGHLSIQGFDLMNDIGVLGYDQHGARAVALFAGASNRQMQSPFNLTKGSEEPDIPVAVAVGQYTADAHRDIAALTFDRTGASHLWMVPSTGAASLSVATTSKATFDKAVEPCGATLVSMDLDGDGKRELLVMGGAAEPGAQGSRIIVARSKPEGDNEVWKLDPPIDFAEMKLSNHPAARSLCRAFALGKEVEEAEGKLGHVEVGNVDAAGTDDLLIMTFVVSGDDQNPVITSSLTVFPDGQLSAGSAVPVTIPDGMQPVTFTLLNADTDPQLEVVYFAPQGTFLAELDLGAKTLTNVATLQDGGDSLAALMAYQDNPPISLNAADFDGDGMTDIALGFLFGTQMFYGVPVKP